MHIVGFIDEEGQDCYGHNYRNDKAARLGGGLFTGLEETGETVNVKKILAPLVPSAILAIGLNYHQHAEETGSKIPKYPVLFMKNPASVTNPGDPILLHPSCMEPPEVDYEAELAVVIGQSAKDVSTADAMGYVLEAGVPCVSWIGCPYYLLDEHDTLDKVDRTALRPLARTATELVKTFMALS